MECLPDSKQAEWKSKLSEKRKGRKPALGMQHTDENRALFQKLSREYWSTQHTYCWDDIKDLSFREANEKYGISKTHYYRLRKRSKTNDLA